MSSSSGSSKAVATLLTIVSSFGETIFVAPYWCRRIPNANTVKAHSLCPLKLVPRPRRTMFPYNNQGYFPYPQNFSFEQPETIYYQGRAFVRSVLLLPIFLSSFQYPSEPKALCPARCGLRKAQMVEAIMLKRSLLFLLCARNLLKLFMISGKELNKSTLRLQNSRRRQLRKPVQSRKAQPPANHRNRTQIWQTRTRK